MKQTTFAPAAREKEGNGNAPVMEDTLYDSESMRRFAGIELLDNLTRRSNVATDAPRPPIYWCTAG